MNKKSAMPPVFTSATAKSLVAALLIGAALGSRAAEPVVPNAGTLLQQVQPAKPATPTSSDTRLKVEQTGAATLPASAPFPVTTIRIIGNQSIDTATLHALIADGEGKALTLADLSALAARITRYYRDENRDERRNESRNERHDSNYPLARAIIPAQTIEAGVVTIEVIEARYGSIAIDNQSRVNDRLLQATLSPLSGGDIIAGEKLDRALLLLSDIPGVTPAAVLKPGTEVGTSDLLVNTTRESMLSGNIVLDNYGSRYTGRTRLGGSVYVGNPLHHGDVLSLSGLSSKDGMNYGRIGYESLLCGSGTRAGVSYSALDYELGGSLSDLDAHGTANITSAWAMQPLIRSRDFNIRTQLQYDHMQLRDDIDASDLRSNRNQNNLTLGIGGDIRDMLWSNTANSWSLSSTWGRLGFDDNAAKSADAATANTQGNFSRLNANVSHLQSISAQNSFYLMLNGQWSDSNLDSSQKMTVGGPYSVRAYDVGVVSGDTGYGGTVEFRRQLGNALQGQWQAVAFIDSAHFTVNTDRWVDGTNSATLSGAGLGLSWTGNSIGRVSGNVAAPIGSTPSLVGDTNTARAWVEASAWF